ncbi:MAG: AAA family ATPase, partial [Clostridium sp.]
MLIYLNLDKPLINYNKLINTKYFVDKSLIIEKINEVIDTSDCCICITRPRRFGKSAVADMLGAYYSKAVDSKAIFDKLNISNCESYEENLNKFNVINISFNKISDRGNTYEDYITMIKESLIKDIKELYPEGDFSRHFTISDMLEATKEKFIFIFDEWDYIFNNNLFEE